MTQALHPSEQRGQTLIDHLSHLAEQRTRHLIALLPTPPSLGIIGAAPEHDAVHSYARRLIRNAQKLGVTVHASVTLPTTHPADTSRLRDCDGVILLKPFHGAEPDLGHERDTEGLHPVHLDRLGGPHETLRPCTPNAALQILEASTGTLTGHTVIYGHGRTVGRPLTQMLHSAGGTVSIISPGTPAHIEAALLDSATGVILACGVPGIYGPAQARAHHHVIDIGVTIEGGVIHGDADRRVAGTVHMLTPRRGGTGRLTSALLMLQLARQAAARQPHALSAAALAPLNPGPPPLPHAPAPPRTAVS